MGCFIHFECCDISDRNVVTVPIWYSYQVWCIAPTCKITFGSVTNLSNYGHFFIQFVCLLISLRRMWWFCSYLVKLPGTKLIMLLKFNLALCQIWVIMAICSYILSVVIARKWMLILFIFGTVIHHNKACMHVKYALARCQNVTFMSIISYILYVCSDILCLFCHKFVFFCYE